MANKVDMMIKIFNILGISIEYLVMKPSKNPAATVKGMVLIKILKEFNREKVFGNKRLAPKAKPAAASIIMAKISIEP